jgi:hypothetical protein
LTVYWPKPFAMRVNGLPEVASADIPADVLGANESVIGVADRQTWHQYCGFWAKS